VALPASAPAGVVSGEIVSFPDGEPLAGVQVLARDPRGASAAGVTDSDGAFLIEGVDPGWVRVQAVPPSTMNRIGAYAGDVSAFCAAETYRLTDEVDGVVIELPGGGSIEGILRDHGGAPSAGAVTAQGVDALNSALRRVAEADGGGEFAVLGLASWVAAGEVVPGAYRVSAQLDGEPPFYAPGTWSLGEAELIPAVRDEVTALDLRRPAGADLSGEVRFAGAGVAGASVEVYAGGFGVVWQGTTDADGAWVAEDVPGAGLTVRVRADGTAETWYGGSPGPSGAAVFAGGTASDLGALGLLSSVSYSLTVTGEDTPIDGSAQVALGAADGTALRTVVVGLVDGEATVAGLPADPLFLTVSVGGWLPVTILVDGAGGAAEVDLAAAHAVPVAVRRRIGGRPLRGARVTAWDGEVALGQATTDGDGAASIAGLPAGPVTLSAVWEPFCAADPGLVPRWSGEARAQEHADPVDLSAAEAVGFALPSDRDRDGMDDVWELAWGLDWGRRDGDEDPDGDGASNGDEYRAHTDPLGPSDPISGCSLAASDPTCVPASLAGLLVLLAGAGRRRGGRRSPDPRASPASLL